jgi:hypothetical protein
MADELEVKVEEEKANSDETGKGKKQEDPPEGSPRWNEIYWKAKEGERAIEEAKELKQLLATKEAGIEEMRKWNKAIVESLDSVKGAISDTTKDDDIAKLDVKLSELKAAKREAREKADFDKESNIDDKIVDLKFEIKEMKAAPKVVVKPTPTAEEGIKPEDEKIYKSWIHSTEWYRTDPKMRGAAIKMEKEVWQDPDFEYADLPEILAEVKLRVEKEFDYKPKPHGNRRSQDGVEGAGGSGRVTVVKLSTAEQDLARNLGVSNEDYAKQKSLINRQKAAGVR